MTQFLTLNKTIRKIGVKRSTLQKQIRNGELPTFEGKITVIDLLRIYPDAKLEDNSLIERIEEIKEKAVKHRHREEAKIVTSEILMTRFNTLKEEYITTKADLEKYIKLIKTISQKINDIEKQDDANLRSSLIGFKDWLASIKY